MGEVLRRGRAGRVASRARRSPARVLRRILRADDGCPAALGCPNTREPDFARRQMSSALPATCAPNAGDNPTSSGDVRFPTDFGCFTSGSGPPGGAARLPILDPMRRLTAVESAAVRKRRSVFARRPSMYRKPLFFVPRANPFSARSGTRSRRCRVRPTGARAGPLPPE